MRITIFFFLTVLSHSCLFSQERFSQWGVVLPQDLAMTVYPSDSTAPAVILHDVGTTWIQDNERKWYVTHTRFRRIKIFDLAAFDQSNLNIVIRAGRSGESLDKIKVQHILPTGVAVPVSSNNFFLEKQNKYYNKMKVFVPNLQKGSIVEYQYELRSDYIFSLYDWYFHQELPVRWSEITTNIRSEFDYQYIARSKRKFDEQTVKNNIDVVCLRLGLSDLPAMKEEPFMTTLDDHRAYVGFQLKRYHPPTQFAQDFMVSWEKAARDLLIESNFGRQYEKISNFNQMWTAFEPQITPKAPPMEIANQVLAFVRSNMHWNNEYRIFTEKDLDDAFARKSGSSADINLAVVALLQKAGLDAIPVLVSTRHNGTSYEQYPFIGQFNSVLALLRVGNEQVLLDGTHPFLPPGQLRMEHYNKRGWQVDNKKNLWMDIEAPEASIIWLSHFKLDGEGTMRGNVEIATSGPIAAEWREDLSAETPENFLKGTFATAYQNVSFDSISISDKTNLDVPMLSKFRCQVPNTANIINDFVYFNPILDFFVSENPFKSLKREFPVNFAYPIKAQYITYIEIPEGYKIEEMPASARIVIPDQAGNISFNCSKISETKIQIILKMTLARSEYGPEYYDVLRQFFGIVGEKVKAQIVLKK
jgi:hypothetical protein